MGEKQARFNKNKILFTIFIVASCICVAFFVMSIMVLNYTNAFEKEIIVDSENVTIEDMSIVNLALHPGESVEYHVSFKSRVSGKYRVDIEFIESENGDLKNFINVSIVDNETAIYDKGLNDALAGEGLSHNCQLEANKPYTLDIKYLMPKTAGNEAMGAKASFKVKFTIQRIL